MGRIFSFIQFINESNSIVNLVDQSKSAKLLADSINQFSGKTDEEIISEAGYGNRKSCIMPFLYLVYSKFLKDSGSKFVFPKEVSPKNLWEKFPTESKKTLNDIKYNFDSVKPGQIAIFQDSAGYSNAGIIFGIDSSKKEFYIFARIVDREGTRIVKIGLKNSIRGIISLFGFQESSEFTGVFEKDFPDSIKTVKTQPVGDTMAFVRISPDGDPDEKSAEDNKPENPFASTLGKAMDFFSGNIEIDDLKRD